MLLVGAGVDVDLLVARLTRAWQVAGGDLAGALALVARTQRTATPLMQALAHEAA